MLLSLAWDGSQFRGGRYWFGLNYLIRSLGWIKICCSYIEEGKKYSLNLEPLSQLSIRKGKTVHIPCLTWPSLLKHEIKEEYRDRPHLFLSGSGHILKRIQLQ